MLILPILPDRARAGVVVSCFLFAIGFAGIGNARDFKETLSSTPSVAQPLSVSFRSEGNCANSLVSFFPIISPSADRVQWNFGDGSTSGEWAPRHTYVNGSSFRVELTAYLGDEVAQAFGVINITASDLLLELVQDTTACQCDLPVNYVFCNGDIGGFHVTVQAQGGDSPQFQWYGSGGILSGQTTEVLTPDSAGYYYVVATTVSGCSAYAGVNIKEYDSPDRRDDLWYFGNNAGIVFDNKNGMGTYAITGPLITPAGSSVMTDRSRQLVLSTDGHQLWNEVSGWNEEITPGNGLGGANTSTQSALVVPLPGDETLYYIFTTGKANASGGSEIRYALFDRKLNGGLGALVADNLLLFTNSTGRITGNANWIIAHEFGNNTFRAYHISREGISQPVLSSIGSNHSFNINPNGSGYMKLGGRNKLAVGVSDTHVGNRLEVFDFNTASGQLTNMKIGDLEISSGHINGVEIFAGGNKIFATWTDGQVSRIYEFAPHVPYRYNRLQWVDHTVELGAIRHASDGRLYVAVDGSSTLLTFTAKADTAVVSEIVLEPFELAPTTTSTLGLPNTVISAPLAPSLSVFDACLGDSTRFFATGNDAGIDKYDWAFGDGQSKIDSGPLVNHLYSAPGEYNVTLTIRNKCQSPVTSMVRGITVRQPPADPSSANVLCIAPILLDANPADLPDLRFRWTTGETTEIIKAHEQGSYGVTITDQYGCSTDAQLIVSSSAPPVDLGEDLVLCQGAAVQALDAMNPGALYEWSVDGRANNNHSRTQPVNTSESGTFVYSVKVTDPVTNCFASDTVMYIIDDGPQFTLSSNSPIECNTSSGQITITVPGTSGTASFDYIISGAAGSFSGTGDASASVFASPATLAAGAYSVTVRDHNSGCENENDINIYAAIERPVISPEGDLLSSSSDVGNQWFRDGVQIVGATGQTYEVTQTGVYTVQVTIGDCSALSLPVSVNITAIENNEFAGINVFPNPSSGTIQIRWDEYSTEAVMELFTAQGVRVDTIQLVGSEGSIYGILDLFEYPSGTYILKVCSGTKCKLVKLRKL